MRFLKFGNNKLHDVSEIVLGTMRIADMTIEQVEELLKTSLEVGINMIDTADIYGRGRCEEILGEVFKKNPGLREKFILQTKCGIRIEEKFTYFDFSEKHILGSVEASLKRLQTDHVECLLLHRPDVLMEPEEIAGAFNKLYEEGKVREFGVSNMNPMMISLLQEYVPEPFVANQVQMSCAFTPMFDSAFNVNMQNDSAVMRDGGILEFCRMNEMIVQAWSVLQYGYFEGVFLGSEKFPKLNEVIDRIANERGVTNTAIALAWILRCPGKMQAVIGTTKPSRVIESAKACDFELTKREWYEIYLAAGNKLP